MKNTSEYIWERKERMSRKARVILIQGYLSSQETISATPEASQENIIMT